MTEPHWIDERSAIFDCGTLLAYLEGGHWLVQDPAPRGCFQYVAAHPEYLPSTGQFLVARFKVTQPNVNDNARVTGVSLHKLQDIIPLRKYNEIPGGLDALFSDATAVDPATLSATELASIWEFIKAKIPAYMLRHPDAEAAVAVLPKVALQDFRSRKQKRAQNPNEQSLLFSCRQCRQADVKAAVGGISIRSMIGFRCRDCGGMICGDCQKAKVKESAAKAGLAGTVVQHLGKAYPYEEWYGEECQFCRTEYEMDWIFGNLKADGSLGSDRQGKSAGPWWQFWR